MAAANPARIAGAKGFEPNLTRQCLRAAQRTAAKGTMYRPDPSSELAAAVAQLATSSVAVSTTKDELATIRVVKKGTVEKTSEDEPQILKAKAKPTPKPKASKEAKVSVDQRPKEEEPTVVQQKEKPQKKSLSKAERRALRREEQAAKRALADEKKREQRKVAQQAKQQRVKSEEQHTTAKPTASKEARIKVVAQPKATQSGIQEVKARKVRLAELRSKHNKYPEEVVDATHLAAKAAVCSFDFPVFLKYLLDGDPKQAQAYLSEAAIGSRPLMQAIISPYLDEVRDALHADCTPADTLHHHEVLVPHVKQSYEDPLVRKSTAQLLYDEGGMHLYQFSETVYVTVTDGEGGVLQAERKYSQTVELYRTKRYIAWLEQHNPIRKGAIDLRAFDRKGQILNDFSLQAVIDPVPVLVGNLQVGMEFRMTEQYVPLSWEVVRFKHQLNRKDSQVCRKNRGNEPIAGIVGLSIVEGLVAEAGPDAAAANDDGAAPWVEEDVPFVALPNPSLGDVKVTPLLLTEETRMNMTRPNPEYVFRTHLSKLPVRAARWVDHSPEQINNLFLVSMTEPDREVVGLYSDPDYRWDPGPPGVADNVVRGPESWFVGPPTPPQQSKHPVVEDVTRKEDALKQRARRLLHAKCPPVPEGHRSWTYQKDKQYEDIPVELIKYWKIQFSKGYRRGYEQRQYNSWLRSVERWNHLHDNERYVSWLLKASVNDTLYPDTLREHLGNMEDLVPSTVYDHECHLCDERIKARELDAELREECMVRNAFGMLTLDMKLYNVKKQQKATKESAVKSTAKIREPVIRAASPVNSNEDSSGSGEVKPKDTHGYDLSKFTNEERAVFLDTYEGRVVDTPWWRKVNILQPSELVNKATEFWVNRGRLLVPPAYG